MAWHLMLLLLHQTFFNLSRSNNLDWAFIMYAHFLPQQFFFWWQSGSLLESISSDLANYLYSATHDMPYPTFRLKPLWSLFCGYFSLQCIFYIYYPLPIILPFLNLNRTFCLVIITMFHLTCDNCAGQIVSNVCNNIFIFFFTIFVSYYYWHVEIPISHQ